METRKTRPMHKTIRLGTRGSPLALAQAQIVAALLAPQAVEIVTLKTSGDIIVDRPLAEVGGKGLFTKELDEALLAGRIDCAVHSLKDVATTLPEGLMLAAILPREDYRDRLIVPEQSPHKRLEQLPPGARIGTSSLRRAAQLLRARPDIHIIPLRGNVGTRLAKLAAGDMEATILAAAGLNRLGHAGLGHPLPIGQMLPAAAQGAITVTARHDDDAMRATLVPLDDLETREAVLVERALLAGLDGSCRTAIAALARFGDSGDIEVRAELYSPDGGQCVSRQVTCDPSTAIATAQQMAAAMRAEAGHAFWTMAD